MHNDYAETEKQRDLKYKAVELLSNLIKEKIDNMINCSIDELSWFIEYYEIKHNEYLEYNKDCLNYPHTRKEKIEAFYTKCAENMTLINKARYLLKTLTPS